MKERRVLIYGCDFCKKTLRHKGAMRNHETHCVYNPNRECGFCEYFKKVSGGDRLHRRLLATLVEVLNDTDLARLRKEANECPGCILAAIVQQRVQAKREGWLEDLVHIGKEDFDFDAEKHRFFDMYQECDEGGY